MCIAKLDFFKKGSSIMNQKFYHENCPSLKIPLKPPANQVIIIELRKSWRTKHNIISKKKNENLEYSQM